MSGFNFIEAIIYLVLYLLIISFAGVLIYGIKKYKKEKRISGIFVTALVSLFLLFIINQLAVTGLYFSSINNFVKKDYKKAAIFSEIGAKIAVFSSQKSTLYGEAGIDYMAMKNGEKALMSFEKAYKIKQPCRCTNNSYLKNDWTIFASMLYTYLGDYEKVYKLANDTGRYNTAAVAAICEKDYKKALGYTDLNLLKQKRSATLYGQRAYIYKKLKKDRLAQEDFQKAISLCRKSKTCTEIQYQQQNDNYWNKFTEKKKEYFKT